MGLSADERAAVTAEYTALRGDGRVFGGARLEPADTATTVRAAGGELLLTDGPFADTKEIVGGFYLIGSRQRGRDAGPGCPYPRRPPRRLGRGSAAGGALGRARPDLP